MEEIKKGNMEKSQNTDILSPEEKEWIADLMREHFETSDRVFKRPYIPNKKLRQAKKRFAPDVDEGSVLCLIDTTITLQAKAGIIIADQGIYWTPKGFKKGKFVPYTQIYATRVEKELGKKGLYLNDDYLQIDDKELLPAIENFFKETREHFIKEWYLLSNEEPRGPYSVSELKDTISSEGIDTLTCSVQKRGSEKWTPITEVFELPIEGPPVEVSLEEEKLQKSISHEIVSEDLELAKGVDLSKYIQWRNCNVAYDTASLDCPGCSENNELQTDLFNLHSDGKESGLVSTGQTTTFRSGSSQKLGKIITFITALIIGSSIASAIGKIPLLYAIFTVTLYLILKPIISSLLSRLENKREMRVFLFKCKNCGKRLLIASDRSEASYIELKEETDATTIP